VFLPECLLVIDRPAGLHNWQAQTLKRLIDILAAGTGLCLFFPLMVVVALLVLITEGPPLLYREERVGRHGSAFPLYKFRTLRPGSAEESSVAPEDDPRITGIGLWLRRWRLDEFPQFFSVLCGHMSLVGPRPMTRIHADSLPPQQLNLLLSVRPGITDATAVYFLAEDAVLAGRHNAEALYLDRLLPAKTLMQINSLRYWTLIGDLQVIARTLMQLWSSKARKESYRALQSLLEGDVTRGSTDPSG
jgi:lipopolysaccharide/colanic/teichoic acid biosynthesis glycosyltransferase